MNQSTQAFPAAFSPFGKIREVFPDVFTVEGGFRFAPGMSISRNMTIVRQRGELTLINSVRLSPEAEVELEKLGKVTNLLRIGAFHGLDDPYYMHRFKPTLWAPPGLPHAPGLNARDLGPDSSPIEGGSVFRFANGQKPEVAVLLERDGGILVTCDSYQHWTTFDGCSFLGRLMMRAMGFGPTHIGGPWTKAMGNDVRRDFDRLLEQPFDHLVPAHGNVLRDAAKEGLRVAVKNRFK